MTGNRDTLIIFAGSLYLILRIGAEGTQRKRTGCDQEYRHKKHSETLPHLLLSSEPVSPDPPLAPAVLCPHMPGSRSLLLIHMYLRPAVRF